jgi:hypothetical protein
MIFNKYHMLTIDAPWLLWTSMDLGQFRDTVDSLNTQLEVCTPFFLNGDHANDLAGLIDEFAVKMHFPEYFGHNAAAFVECLSDLSWLNFDALCVVLTNADRILIDQPSEARWLIQTLSKICSDWGRPINVGEPWDRSAKPFHVIFVNSDQDPKAVLDAFSTLPLLVPDDASEQRDDDGQLPV